MGFNNTTNQDTLKTKKKKRWGEVSYVVENKYTEFSLISRAGAPDHGFKPFQRFFWFPFYKYVFFPNFSSIYQSNSNFHQNSL